MGCQTLNSEASADALDGVRGVNLEQINATLGYQESSAWKTCFRNMAVEKWSQLSGGRSRFLKLSSKKWRAAVSDGLECRQKRIHRPNANPDTRRRTQHDCALLRYIQH